MCDEEAQKTRKQTEVRVISVFMQHAKDRPLISVIDPPCAGQHTKCPAGLRQQPSQALLYLSAEWEGTDLMDRAGTNYDEVMFTKGRKMVCKSKIVHTPTKRA